jgi:hypothetical protein
MNKNANFKVDPKLAELLGETYKSTENAIKEFMDNAFDADADNVWITLTEVITKVGNVALQPLPEWLVVEFEEQLALI